MDLIGGNLNLNQNIFRNISVQFRVERNPVLVSEAHVVSYFILLLKTSLFKIQAAGKWIAMVRVIQSPVSMQS